jgi:hypothetical protein
LWFFLFLVIGFVLIENHFLFGISTSVENVCTQMSQIYADFFKSNDLILQGLREGWQWSSFFFINCHGFKPVAIDKEKKRERTARPLWSRPYYFYGVVAFISSLLNSLLCGKRSE